MSYNNGIDFGYDEIGFNPSNNYFNLNAQNPVQIGEFEKMLEKKPYMLNPNQRQCVKFNTNDADIRRNPRTGGFSKDSLDAVQYEMSRKDIMHNIENHYMGNRELYPTNYYGRDKELSETQGKFISYKHSDDCGCGRCQSNSVIDSMKKSIEDLQKKNDFMLLTILTIVIYFIMKLNFQPSHAIMSVPIAPPAPSPPIV